MEEPASDFPDPQTVNSFAEVMRAEYERRNRHDLSSAQPSQVRQSEGKGGNSHFLSDYSAVALHGGINQIVAPSIWTE